MKHTEENTCQECGDPVPPGSIRDWACSPQCYAYMMGIDNEEPEDEVPDEDEWEDALTADGDALTADADEWTEDGDEDDDSDYYVDRDYVSHD